MRTLQSSEKVYRVLYEDNPTMYFVVDADGEVLSVNRFGAEQLGYPVEELLGQQVTGVFHEEDRKAVLEQLRSCCQNPGQVFEWELRKVRSDGGVMWVREQARAVKESDGSSIVLIVCEDITERRRTERELRESRERYRILYSRTPAMMHSIDSNFCIVDVTDHWLEVMGYERLEVLGWPLTDFMTEESQRLATEVYLPRFMEVGYVRDLRYQFVKKSGDIVDVLLSSIAEYGEDGRYLRSLAHLEDITERKRAEDALRRARDELEERVAERTMELMRSREHFRRLVETVRIVPWECEVGSTQVTYIGPQAVDIFGYPRERWYEDRFWLDRVHTEDLPVVLAKDRHIAESGSSGEIEYRMTAINGEVVWIHELTNFVEGRDDDPPMLQGFMIDVTARKHAEELLRESEAALRSSQQALRDLAGQLLRAQEEERRRVARELHDDITQRLVGLSIKMGRRREGLETQVEERSTDEIETIRQELVQLSGDVRTISRQLHPSMLEHLGLEDALRSECENFFGRTGIQLDFNSRDVPREISTELGIGLYRIAQEALQNVFRHARVDHAEVALEGSDGYLTLRVDDTGHGFDPATVDYKRGIGLASMAERARLIEADLTIQSEAGKGTSILVRAPLRREEVLEETGLAISPDESSGGAPN